MPRASKKGLDPQGESYWPNSEHDPLKLLCWTHLDIYSVNEEKQLLHVLTIETCLLGALQSSFWLMKGLSSSNKFHGTE